MDNLYEQLGFRRPNILTNPYGIRIYVGGKDKDDWCVVIPKWLCDLKCSHYKWHSDHAVYLITEKEALSIAKRYTELAQKYFNSTKGVFG